MTDRLMLSGCFNLRVPCLTSSPKPPDSLNNVQWSISVDTTVDEEFLSVSIHNNSESHLQEFDANIRIKVKYGERERFERSFNYKFDFKNNPFCIKEFMPIEQLTTHQHIMDDFEIDVFLNFRSQKTANEIDFCDKNSTFNDIILKFEDSDKELYSSRAMLSIHSKVFNVMLNSTFEERDKDIIKLNDDKFEEFKTMLSVIYPTKHKITRQNIEILMKLADKYDMPNLIDRCVEFVENDEKIPFELKFSLADKYSLAKIHNDCIRSFNDIETLEKFQELEVFENLLDKTKIAVLRRVFKILKQQDERDIDW